VPQATSSAGACPLMPTIGWSSGWTGFAGCATRETCSSRPGSGGVLDLPGVRDTLAKGQAMEFLVWTELVLQSRGLLHVFLPLLDRGLDAIVHRLTDGEFIGIQVKSRTGLRHGMVSIVTLRSRWVGDRALIIATLATDTRA